MDTTFDVRVWQIERGSGKLRESYGVRWSVGGKRHRMTFQTFALADGFRAELVTATHAGGPFNMSTGLSERHEPRASSVGCTTSLSSSRTPSGRVCRRITGRTRLAR